MLLHGTLVGTVPVAVPEHGVVSVQVEVEAPRSEFPVEKIRFPDSSLAGPAPAIQIESKRKLVAEVGCLSSSWFAPSAVRVVVPFHAHPKSQPRDEWPVGLLELPGKPQKLEKAAKVLPLAR